MDLELRVLLFKLAMPALLIALIAPLVLYLIVKWRANRDAASGGNGADPQLGFKFVLYYFGTLAFQLALVGGTLLLYTMIKPSGDEFDTKGFYYRMSLGLILPAALVLGGHVALIMRTNDAQQPGVRKLFVALNLMFTGILGFSALVVGFQALFAKGSTSGLGHLGGAGILVYCGAWALLGWRYYQLAAGGTFGGDGQEMPDVVLPPAPPPSQAASGGGLPALGGGSFPPIEPPK